ncbi:MAG TPA: hypothetical protein VG477_01275 [Thermoanaerobaculia bacterium]|nr:hypothetical protein [Thermoanaerobaculia bacterium]
MKKNVKKITLSRETLRDLDAKRVVGGDDMEKQETATCLTRVACGVLIGD